MNKIEFTDQEWEDIRNNKAYCPALFTSVYLNAQNGVGACCVFDETRSQYLPKTSPGDTIPDLLNTDIFKEVRKAALAGEKHSACKHCWRKQEITPEREYRKGFIDLSLMSGSDEVIRNNIYEDYSVDYDNVKLDHLDVRLSTLCNLKCRTCSSLFSSSWYPEDVAYYEHITKKYPDRKFGFVESWAHKTIPTNISINDIKPHLSNIQRIYFAGGEPLMMDEHFEILQTLIDLGRTDVSLTYNTNFSKLVHGKKYDVIEYWKQFSNVVIGASLDGSHEKGEYIRKNIVWPEVENNIQRLRKEAPHVKFYLSPTVSFMNAYNIVEFHKEWVSKGYIGHHDIMLNFLYGPDFYCITNLPDNHKQKLTAIYESHLKWLNIHTTNSNTTEFGDVRNDFRDLIKMMNSKPQDPEWVEKMDKNIFLDKLRDEDFFTVFPEYEDLRPLFT
jgi:organic radical activating enzyme